MEKEASDFFRTGWIWDTKGTHKGQCVAQLSSEKLLLSVDDNFNRDPQLDNVKRVRHFGVLCLQ